MLFAIQKVNKIMQHLQSFPPDLNQSRRLELSKLFYSSSSLPSISRSASLEFVPFLQQRDNMGKLLTSTSNRYNQLIGTGTFSKLFPLSQQYKQEELTQSLINKVVSSFFKKNDMETRQLARAKFLPKKIVIINQKQSNKSKQFNDASYDIETALNLVKDKKKNCIIRPQPKSNFPSKFSQRLSINIEQNKHFNAQNKGAQLLRTYSMTQRKSDEIKGEAYSPKKKTFESAEPFQRSQNLLSSLKVRLNPEQLDYKRYKQQQQRSLKVFEDYEQGHQKFKLKMKESKLIAYNIRKQLQID